MGEPVRTRCSQCGETVDTDDVLIEGGRIECPKCKSGMLLDDLLKDSSAPWQNTGALIPPPWLQASEVASKLTLRWKWNHHGRMKWRHLFVSVIATLFVAMFAVAGAMRGGSLLPLAGYVLVTLVGIGCTLVILVQLVNSASITFDGQELAVWYGPMFGPGRRRVTRIAADQITSLCFRRSGQSPHFDYNLAYRTIDGRGWQLNCSVKDGAGARYIKRRLDAALGLNL